MIDKIKKLPGGIKFMLGVIIIYLIIGSVDINFAQNSFHKFLQTFIGMLPILALVFTIAFIVNIFLNPEIIKKHLGHDSGLRGWLYAVLGSIVISGPPYIIFPLLGQLKKHGMKYSLLAVFLNNRSVQPVFLPVMAHYFGWSFTVVVAIYTLFFSILNGIFMEKVIGIVKHKMP